MEYLELAGVPVPLSRLVLGTMTFGDTAELEPARSMVDAAIDAGVTSLDTANGYAGGRSEEIVGALLRGRRDKVVLATKAGIHPGDAGDAALLSAVGLRRSLEASLRRLDVDSVDIYYLHRPDRTVPLSETLSTLADFVREGSVGAIGVSNYSAWQIADILQVGAEVGAPKPVLAQQMYNLIARRLEDEYTEFASTHGVDTIVYNPLGAGLLTGRYSSAQLPAEGRFGSAAIAGAYRDRYWNQRNFEVVDELSTIAAEAGVTLPALAIRWLLSKPVVSSVLIGGSRVEQIEETIAAADAGPLPDDVVARCDRAGEPLRGSMPSYNR
jgi:aryl-alcohol dehydrogenase-like predicted oxidoreductase